MSADTPSTDEAEMPIDRVDTIASRPACVVNADFARTLERELAALREQNAQLLEALEEITRRTVVSTIWNIARAAIDATREGA